MHSGQTPWVKRTPAVSPTVLLQHLPVVLVRADLAAVGADRQHPLERALAGPAFLQLAQAIGQLHLQPDHAQADLQARLELDAIERLGHVIVGARLQTGDDIGAVWCEWSGSAGTVRSAGTRRARRGRRRCHRAAASSSREWRCAADRASQELQGAMAVFGGHRLEAPLLHGGFERQP